MVTEVSEGIKIEVNNKFREELSNLGSDLFIFSYEITITNQNDFDVQLLSRYWHIYDSLDEKRIVEGPGVVGQQPVIKPHSNYVYESSCDLRSDAGYMRGYYIFKNTATNKYFKVSIPRFEMIYPGKLN